MVIHHKEKSLPWKEIAARMSAYLLSEKLIYIPKYPYQVNSDIINGFGMHYETEHGCNYKSTSCIKFLL